LLSIIIVNYNVQYFIEQCLYSVQKAITGMNAEVIVIDNNSTDESVAYLQKNFSWIHLIRNKENSGYARANNQGLQAARGDYILFLNPDTILGEDCLASAIDILQQNNHAGALGIRMIDGTGRFLPESKRGFPSPQASFYKLSGLVKIFPRSRAIARYYMGWLPEQENNEVDVLSGAFMMVKKEVLEKTGGFDEQFFMYGEDIDLSFRVRQAGYKNYYLGKSSIIHFKGESTKKDARYTILFYKAMGIFVQKQYKKRSWAFSILLRIAIAVSGALSFAGRLLFPVKSRQYTNAIRHTLLVGDRAETKRVAANTAAGFGPRREITCIPAIPGIYSAIQSGKTDEIIFCAGTLSYRDIISCIESLAGQMEYKFFAAGSNSVVGSSSKGSSGETMVLPAG
jgi:GT2 family glycosyltransferase